MMHTVLANVCKFSNAVAYSQGCTVASILDPMTRFEVVLIDNKGKFVFSLVSVSPFFSVFCSLHDPALSFALPRWSDIFLSVSSYSSCSICNI